MSVQELHLVSQAFFFFKHFLLTGNKTVRPSTRNTQQVTLTCAPRGSLAHRVTHFTVADEGASGVLTVSTQADVCVQLTLVHIYVHAVQ